MNQITRYVVSEMLKVFVVTLAGMTLLVLLVGLAQQALREGLGPGPLLRLIPYVVPNALRFAVPGTILFAACNLYGRMSASNEIVAIKSLGVPPSTVVVPTLVLAFFLSLVTVWLNDVAVSWGRLGIQRVVLQSIEQIAYGTLRSSRSFHRNRFSISVRKVEGRHLIQPTLVFHPTDRGAPITMVAERAELRFNPENNSLSCITLDAELEGQGVNGLLPGITTHDIPLSVGPKDGASVGPSDLPLWQIPRSRNEQREEIARLEQNLAADASFQMLTGDFGSLNDKHWQLKQVALQRANSRLFRLQTEPWRRWANGFSCFFFVMVGAPLAIRLKNADFWTSFGLCFLPILLVYYPLLMYGTDRAKCGQLPPYSVWLGNIILGIIGCWLLRRMMRY